MFKSLTIPACLAAALIAIQGEVNGQGVVREGVRRSTEAAAEGGRAAVRGSRSVINRAGQATRDAVGRTTEATRNQVDRRIGNVPRVQSDVRSNAAGNIDANTSGSSQQLQADADLDFNRQPLQTRDQFQAQGNIDSATQQQRYESGYRGVDDQGYTDQGYAEDQQFATGQQQATPMYNDGRTYVLRHDGFGREFICVNGRAVYFDNSQSGQAQSHQAYKLGDDQQYERQFNGQQYSDDQLRQDSRFQQDQYRQREVQRNTYAPQNGYGQPPAPPVPAQSGVNSADPANSSLNQATDIDASTRQEFDTANDSDLDSSSFESETQSNIESDVSTNTDSASSADTNDADQSDQSASSSDSASDEPAARSSDDRSDASSSDSDDESNR